MSKPKLLIYSEQLANCSCFHTVFNTKFEAEVTYQETHFLKKIQEENVDTAVVCFCSAQEKDVERLLRLDALTGPVPVLTCSRTLNADFVQMGAKQGVDRFLQCTMEAEKIHDLIFEAIRRGGLKEYLKSCTPGSLEASPYVRKMVDEIIHAFPHRLKAEELAERLGITRR